MIKLIKNKIVITTLMNLNIPFKNWNNLFEITQKNDNPHNNPIKNEISKKIITLMRLKIFEINH
jgi:hypothetical protein